MLLATKDKIDGKKLEILGLVKGSTIQTVNFLKDFSANLKTIVGGELKSYNKMMIKARDLATDRMVDEAFQLGADAIVGLRFATAAVMNNAAEIMAYGTAVKFLD